MRVLRGTAIPGCAPLLEPSTFDFRLLPVLPIPPLMLTFSVYEQADWRALKRPRLEFRGARGKRRGGKKSQRGDRPRHQQTRGGARHPPRASTWNQNARESFQKI